MCCQVLIYLLSVYELHVWLLANALVCWGHAGFYQLFAGLKPQTYRGVCICVWPHVVSFSGRVKVTTTTALGHSLCCGEVTGNLLVGFKVVILA